MCNSSIDLSCDVLVPGHHGSATATSWDFLQKTVPEYAVISCGTNNKYGHPDKDTMDKLQSMDIQVYRTDKQGTIVVTSDGANLNWSAEPCNDYTPGDDSDQGTRSTSEVQQEASQTAIGEHVWVSATGNKYHKTDAHEEPIHFEHLTGINNQIPQSQGLPLQSMIRVRNVL